MGLCVENGGVALERWEGRCRLKKGPNGEPDSWFLFGLSVARPPPSTPLTLRTCGCGGALPASHLSGLNWSASGPHIAFSLHTHTHTHTRTHARTRTRKAQTSGLLGHPSALPASHAPRMTHTHTHTHTREQHVRTYVPVHDEYAGRHHGSLGYAVLAQAGLAGRHAVDLTHMTQKDDTHHTRAHTHVAHAHT
jgi:hypothetical protein